MVECLINANRAEESCAYNITVGPKLFTEDWFSHNIKQWDKYKPNFVNKADMRCLEIGAFEGRSTNYIAENYCNGNGSIIDVVDTWKGSIEHQGKHKNGLYERFINNVAEHLNSNRVYLHRDYSSNVLLNFVQEKKSGNKDQYDFIYIDASHTAKDVMIDAVLSWELLKVSGIMAFDDYTWKNPKSSKLFMTPKPAIDGFLASYDNLYELLHNGSQVHIKKIGEFYPEHAEMMEV